MTLHVRGRRALLSGAMFLGATAIAVGCDAVQFAADPKPRFEETWNLPAGSNRIWVKDLLPTNGTVTIPTDSSAFLLKIDSTNITRIVGNDCAQCVTLNGQNAPKPQFVLSASNSSALPQDVVSASILGGDTLSVRLVNNMSFDPLYVNTNAGATTQGFMLIVVRSGSLVLARDSVRGAAAASGTVPYCPTGAGASAICNSPFPKNGGVLTRKMLFSTGTVTTNLSVDVTINSPLGDHNEFINANGTLDALAKIVPTLRVGSVSLTMPAGGRNLNSGNQDMDLGSVSSESIIQGTLAMTIANPFAGITGNLAVTFSDVQTSATIVSKSITLPSGSGTRSVTLDSTQIQSILGKKVNLSVSGTVTSAAAFTVTPKQVVAIDNRLIVKLRTPSGGN